MKPFMKTVPCTISTLSPVHIGCGEDYYPTNYVIDGGFLHSFSEEALIEALTPAEKQRLASLADEQGDEGIKKLQGFIHSKRDNLKAYASHSVPVSKKLAEFYASRIGKTTQHEGGGKKVNNKLEIARNAFNPYTQTPYLAGSSIKGAIRTALLNAINDKESLQTRLNELKVTNQQGRPLIANENTEVKNFSDKLQKHLLGYNKVETDPLRLLKVSDANYQHPDNLYGAEIRFAVNRKNKPLKEGIKTKADSGIPLLMECLPAHRSRCLPFDLTFLTDEKLVPRWTERHIIKACNDFFLPQLEKELTMLQQLGLANKDWASGLEKLLNNELGDALKQQQAFLLRIGQHGGAESNTLDGVRHIKIMQGQGNKPKFLPKPTTIWLTADHKDQQHDLLPFGWVLVEIGTTQLTKTQQFLSDHAQADKTRQQELQTLTTQRTEFFTKKRLEQEKQAKKDAEAAEEQRLKDQADAEKAAQLATMSETQKAIFELQQQYETAKTKAPEPNGTLRQLLTQTINQASDWTSEEKQALLKIGNELCSFWGKPTKLKKQLQALQA